MKRYLTLATFSMFIGVIGLLALGAIEKKVNSQPVEEVMTEKVEKFNYYRNGMYRDY